MKGDSYFRQLDQDFTAREERLDEAREATRKTREEVATDLSNPRPGDPCLACGRKGLHYMDHPHAYGHKDVSRLQCRFCKAVMSV